MALCGLLRVADAKDCVDPKATAGQDDANDKAVTMCFGAGDCWAFDVTAHTWSSIGAFKPPPDKGASSVVDHTKIVANIHVCSADNKDCHQVDLPDGQTMYNLETRQSADRTRVVIQGQGDRAYLFDGVSKKLVTAFKPWKSKMEPGTFRGSYFLDGTLALYVGSSPITDEVRLFDGATGKAMGVVDDGIVGEPLELSDGDWAFFRIEHDDYVVANSKTGKLGKGIVLRGPGVGDLTGGTPISYRTTDKKQVLFAHGDASSGIVVYDLATKKQSRFSPPLCKK